MCQDDVSGMFVLGQTRASVCVYSTVSPLFGILITALPLPALHPVTHAGGLTYALVVVVAVVVMVVALMVDVMMVDVVVVVVLMVDVMMVVVVVVVDDGGDGSSGSSGGDI